jgi:hypothetical protein
MAPMAFASRDNLSIFALGSYNRNPCFFGGGSLTGREMNAHSL